MAASITAEVLGNVGALDTLNRLLDPLSFRAGWNKHEPSLWAAPRTRFRPAQWTWAHARPALDSAGRLIGTDLAERRNLFLVNPCEGNYYATLRTLVSAYQMIRPGERARSHRHTPNALRLVLDGPETAYTVVDGVRIDMMPGDVVLTPGWCWHGHGNDGDRPAYWIDFLDVPLVHLLEPMFLENWPSGFQEPGRADRDPAYVFPWSETEKSLQAARPDAYGRTRVELGAPALPTVSLHMERVEPGQAVVPLRTTASQIMAVVSGQGTTTVEGQEFRWSRGDVIAIPAWHRYFTQADADSIVFVVSDQPALERLGFLRIATE